MSGVFDLKAFIGFEVSFPDSRVPFIESAAFVVLLPAAAAAAAAAAGCVVLGYLVGNNSHKHYVALNEA